MIKYLFLTLLIFITSCVPEYSQKKVLNCYVPPEDCYPRNWNGITIDTGRSKAKDKKYFEVINLQKINSKNDEFHLGFLDSKSAIMTYSEISSLQKTKEVLVVENDNLSPKSEMSFIDGPYGLVTANKTNLIFSGIPSYLSKNEEEYFRNKSRFSDFLEIPLDRMDGRIRLFSAKLDNRSILDTQILSLAWGLDDFEWESHPAFGPEGKFVFFSSTRKGGLGNTDIWVSKIEKNSINGEPKNLGSKINSICYEMSPFISKDRTKLIFASTGRDNLGGFDLFYSEINPKFWDNLDLSYLSEPKNLGKPINSEANELFPSSPGETDKLLYFSSDRNGSFGGYDMYVFLEKIIEKLEKGEQKKREIKVDDLVVKNEFDADNVILPEVDIKKDSIPTTEQIITETTKIDTNRTFNISGNVQDKEHNPISKADVKVKVLENGELQAQTQSDTEGNYSLEVKAGKDLEVLTQSGDYFIDSYVIPKEIQDTLQKFEKNIILSNDLTIRINFPYDVFDNPYKYLIDENGNETKSVWENELDNIAKNIIKSLDKIKKIKLVGHTDPQASDDYNYNLGLNRVKFVQSELSKRGVPKKMIEVRSAGEKEPIERKPNEDDETYFKRLRRVSVEKIIK